jgi:hypothetical protein
MRNALALYEYHLPDHERGSFLALLFPRVPAAKRKQYLKEIVTPVPPFHDPGVEGALAELRPRTAISTHAILNAADIAVRLPFDERDRFVRSVCGLAATAQGTSRMTLFDAHRSTLRHLSNEDRRVVRAVGSLSSDPYAYARRYTHRNIWRASSDYLAELHRQQTEEDVALIAAMDAGKMPRVFRDEDSRQLQLHYLLCTGHEVNEAFSLMERDAVGSRSSRKRHGSAPAADAAMAVDRTRHENDVRVLHDQRGALQAQLTAKTTIIETLEQERASDRKRIAELEAAQNRTLQAFKELQHAENRRLDAYMGVRGAAN